MLLLLSPVVQSCRTVCDPRDCSMLGFSVLHHLPELAQIRVHWVSDAIQPSHPLSSPSPPAIPVSGSFPMSRLFASRGQITWTSASASVPPMSIQDWFPLELTDLVSLQPKRLSGVFSNTTVQKHQFFSVQPSLWSDSHPYMTTEKAIALTRQTFVGKLMSLLFSTLSRLS